MCFPAYSRGGTGFDCTFGCPSTHKLYQSSRPTAISSKLLVVMKFIKRKGVHEVPSLLNFRTKANKRMSFIVYLYDEEHHFHFRVSEKFNVYSKIVNSHLGCEGRVTKYTPNTKLSITLHKTNL